jgi:hypothetical protein
MTINLRPLRGGADRFTMEVAYAGSSERYFAVEDEETEFVTLADDELDPVTARGIAVYGDRERSDIERMFGNESTAPAQASADEGGSEVSKSVRERAAARLQEKHPHYVRRSSELAQMGKDLAAGREVKVEDRGQVATVTPETYQAWLEHHKEYEKALTSRVMQEIESEDRARELALDRDALQAEAQAIIDQRDHAARVAAEVRRIDTANGLGRGLSPVPVEGGAAA